jgi:hypothetical protein
MAQASLQMSTTDGAVRTRSCRAGTPGGTVRVLCCLAPHRRTQNRWDALWARRLERTPDNVNVRRRCGGRGSYTEQVARLDPSPLRRPPRSRRRRPAAL